MYRTEFGNLLRLAYPLILAQLAQNTLSFVDTLMVGSLGEEALAGIAIGSSTFHFVVFVLAGVIFAISPLVSHAVGAQQHQAVPRIVRQGFWVAAVFSLPAFVLFWNAEPILRLLGQSEGVIRMSGGYLRAMSFGALPALLTVSLRGFLEGTSNTRPILLISLLAVLLNVFLNDALIFGRYGLPALGLVGTGVASSIVYTLIFLITAIYVLRTQQHAYPIFAEIHLPHLETIKELLQVGIPICLTLGFEIGLFSASAFVMGVIDARQLAAHQIALQSASITFMVPLGIALATCVRVGQFTGSSDMAGARIAGRVGMVSATAVMGLSAVIFAVFPERIIGLYFDTGNPDNETVLRHATTFLRIAGLFQIVDGLQVVASNALRGLKETTAAMYLTLLAYWMIGAPACLTLAFVFKQEGRGLWYGLTIGLAAAAVMLTWRFHRHFNTKA